MIRTMQLSRRRTMAGGLGLLGAGLMGRQVRAQGPVAGGTLTVAADSEPRNLNPALVASNGVFYVASKVIEPLVEMAYDGFTPKLATEWSGSDDGLSATFTLREGVTWHDGTPFTSADVAFSAVELWAKLQNLGRTTFANLTSADTPDDHTVTLHFSKPIPFQLVLNALPALSAVVPKHLYEGTDIPNNPHNEQLVGTGPFKYVQHEPGQFYILERNPDYWGTPEPYLERIVYRVMPDRGAIAAAHEAGELDLSAFSAVSLDDMQRLSQVPGLRVIPVGYEGITYFLTLEINHRRPELANPLVRQALAHAIDKQFIVDTILKGYGAPATGPIPTTAKDFYTADVSQYPYDPEKAKQLLAEAGTPSFSVRLLPAPFFEQTRLTGDYVAQALKAVGIEVELVSNDTPTHLAAVYTDHNFDLAIGSPVYRNDPAISTTILYTGGLPSGVPFSNQYGYDSPQMNELLAAAASELDPARRIALYQEFQKLAQADLPLIPLAQFTFLTVAADKVQDVANNPRWATSSWSDTWVSA